MFKNFTDITLAIQRTKIAHHAWEEYREWQANKRKLQGQRGRGSWGLNVK